ncbi:hypothetical protein BTVI_111736 [Pitangus sulphuratus]|nr:hypothetical protein BTVI_111736 [Pitangus sulphuratus]
MALLLVPVLQIPLELPGSGRGLGTSLRDSERLHSLTREEELIVTDENFEKDLALAIILPTAICRVPGSTDRDDCPAGFCVSLLECHQERDHMGIPMAESLMAKEPLKNKTSQEVLPAGNITQEKTPTHV